MKKLILSLIILQLDCIYAATNQKILQTHTEVRKETINRITDNITSNTGSGNLTHHYPGAPNKTQDHSNINTDLGNSFNSGAGTNTSRVRRR